MVLGHGSMGDGSDGSWVTKDDPFPSLLVLGSLAKVSQLRSTVLKTVNIAIASTDLLG